MKSIPAALYRRPPQEVAEEAIDRAMEYEFGAFSPGDGRRVVRDERLAVQALRGQAIRASRAPLGTTSEATEAKRLERARHLWHETRARAISLIDTVQHWED